MAQSNCALCGVTFQAQPANQKYILKFCSDECRFLSQKKSFMVPCIRCGAPFLIVPNKIFTGQIYCSHACSKIPPIERFWKHVKKGDGPNAHWFWTASLHRVGYGTFHSDNGTTAHRFSWETHNGPIPEGMDVLHNCSPLPDLKHCVNPAHLFLGTHQDNMKDAAGKQQHPHGEGHFFHKLTDPQIIAIRIAFHFSQQNHCELARQYFVHHGTIRAIVIGHTWKHLPVTPEELLKFLDR